MNFHKCILLCIYGVDHISHLLIEDNTTVIIISANAARRKSDNYMSRIIIDALLYNKICFALTKLPEHNIVPLRDRIGLSDCSCLGLVFISNQDQVLFQLWLHTNME